MLKAVRNPLAYIDSRWTPSQRTLRRATLTAVVMSVVIVVTGGAVRLTGSGLGCDTWPKCTDDSLFATPEMGLHGAIEFGNRMLTYVLCAAVGWAIVAARSTAPRRRGLTRLAWAQFWIVAANAVLGGITVLTGLNPYSVAGHFLLATALITVTVLTWHRAGEGDAPARPLVGPRVRQLGTALLLATAALIVVGTVVTGAGPHAGDSSEVPRIPLEWEAVTRAHAALAWLVVALTLALWLLLRAMDAPPGPLARTRDLALVLASQIAVGYVQYVTDVPELLVGVHLLGSTLVWIAVLRVVLSLRERGTPAVAGAAEGAGEGARPVARPAAVV
ncbi:MULTISPECIES: COX15/CtaA family protein [unclassified Streptomyces]|uniref:COX15/CtaA family protein n=1 Tax=unclassified Streptomyces TaxID=2593676 RepID=UPI0022B5FDA5|nr:MULTISPECIES: COX15/CtaA family protein [unclassified Streptomyces]MCZ7413628.1 COX15/CtaA family protein [Streptomyces sp. WMMC897]MCZ7430624.1 COX15/CtaA family protein [Streptomyces sp. WMMC1477]